MAQSEFGNQPGSDDFLQSTHRFNDAQIRNFRESSNWLTDEQRQTLSDEEINALLVDAVNQRFRILRNQVSEGQSDPGIDVTGTIFGPHQSPSKS